MIGWSVRIIGGEARGRRLRGPGRLSLRPTPDRVREALFNILAGEVTEGPFLDLFAGTGAVALEALSRGSPRAVLVERHPGHAALARGNLERCHLADQGRLLVLPVAAALVRLAAERARFRLVYLDPPYAEGDGRREALVQVARGGVLEVVARVILELPSREDPPSVGGLEPGEVRRYGDTALAFYFRSPGSTP